MNDDGILTQSAAKKNVRGAGAENAMGAAAAAPIVQRQSGPSR
jgi:hypothetical protein